MTVNLKDNVDLENSSVHYMPCKIHFDGEAKISSYFTVNKNDNTQDLTASFRGYPLTGKVVKVPEGYTGRIFKEGRRPNADNMPRHLKATHKFDSLVYWNWDQPPTKADPFISALDWIQIAKAVHGDPTEDEGQ